jgi:hypothetical protein
MLTFYICRSNIDMNLVFSQKKILLTPGGGTIYFCRTIHLATVAATAGRGDDFWVNSGPAPPYNVGLNLLYHLPPLSGPLGFIQKLLIGLAQ